MRQGFVGFVLLAGGLVTPSPALPEPLSDSEKIERLQQQTELLQKQLKALQEEVRQAKRRAEAGQAKKAEASVYRWQTSTAETSAVDPPAAETYTADPLPPHRRQVRLEPPPPVVSPGQDGTPGILQVAACPWPSAL